MSLNLSIKDVPEDVASRLRERAARNHRSLQGELMCIVTEAAAQATPAAASAASADRSGLYAQGWKTIEDLLAERRAHPLSSTTGLPLAVDIVRADRDSR